MFLLLMACGSKNAEVIETTARSARDEAPPEAEDTPIVTPGEGKAGKPSGDRPMSREEAIEAARTAGVLGAPASIRSGFDDTNVYGGLTGESRGGLGYGRSGFGPGGGGSGRHDTIGRAPAPARSFDGVKAGEWDDNANYRDYTKWLKEAPRGIARLDTSDRQFVVVRDADGKPVPNCPVTLIGSARSVHLTTSSAGRVLVFPNAYRLGKLEAAATTCAGSQARVPLGNQVDAVTSLSLSTRRALPARRTIDLAFVVDTTGSMSEEIEAVKETIRAVATKLAGDQTDVRIGLVEYKDRHDDIVTRVFPFSSNLDKFSRSVADLTAAGGGDRPEDMHAGLNASLDQLTWRADATARMVIVIADAPPHLDYQEPDYAVAARRAAQSGIKLYTVAASGMDTTGQVVMRQLAQFTGATNLFVLRGGAGPQSTGGGDPKSSCGGTQEQYASGNLHALVISKIKRELAALDADPMKIAGLGKDESSKPCDQRIATR